MSVSEATAGAINTPYSYAAENAAVEELPVERVHKGRRLVISGFCIAVLGIFIYCFGALSTVPDTVALNAGETAPLSRWVIVGLSMIGTGTLLWMIGMIRHLNAFLDLPHAEQTSALGG
ncbi:MAG: hypothetical protein AB7K09_02700 [Planctomycetota bacterium]